MLTREQILEIDHYCAEHKMSLEARMDEIGVPHHQYYRWKKKYRDEDAAGIGCPERGSFVQLTPGGTARKLIGGYRGAVQTDGYEVYESFENAPGKRMIGCWAHVRRKFVEALVYTYTLLPRRPASRELASLACN